MKIFRHSKRTIFFAFGILFLILGLVGAFLPIVPTVPFVILANICFARSSERFHQWLLHHPWFGPDLRSWERYGVIRPRAKFMATLLIIPSFALSALFVRVSIYVKTVVILTGLLVLAFIWTRPSAPPD